MPFLGPEHILQDQDNKLSQKEKSQLQKLAKQINQISDTMSKKEQTPLQSFAQYIDKIGDKISSSLLQKTEKQENTTKSAEKTIIGPLTQDKISPSGWEHYKAKTMEYIKNQFNLEEIAKDPSKRTPEKIAMLQLFLFLKGAYSDGKTSEELSARNIDGKRGRRTEDACYKAEILKRSKAEQDFIDTIKSKCQYSTGFAQAELGGELSMRRHQKGGPVDYTNVDPDKIQGTFGIYGWVVRGEKSSGLLHGLFNQRSLGKELPRWEDEHGKEYPKDFKSFKRFVKRILTDYRFAADVAVKYEKSLLEYCNNDIGEAAAFNLGGYAGVKAYRNGNYNFRIGKNATIGAYIKKVVDYSDPNAPKPKRADVLKYTKPPVQTSEEVAG